MSAILGQLGRLGTLGVASTGGLTKAALINRLKTYGALAFYMPSEYLTTAWQRYDATTDRAAVGYGVGFLGDVMQGMALGPELVINGDFSAGTTGWSRQDASLAVVDGKLKITNTSAINPDGYAFQEAITSNFGDFYVVDGLSINDSGTSVAYHPEASPGTSVSFAIVRSTKTWVRYHRRNMGPIGSYSYSDNCTMKRLYGRHSTQPTESNRPALRYAGGIYYLDQTSGQGLTAYLPASVGGTVTAVYANPGVGAVVVTGVTVTSQSAWLPYKHSGLVIMPSTASAEAVAAVAAMVDVLSRRVVV